MPGMFTTTREKCQKKEKMHIAKIRKRRGDAPANPGNPAKPCVGISTALPSWMYGNPADVAERIEQAEIARVERKRKRATGLLGAGTVKMIKQLRIRELVAKAMRGGRR